MEGTPQIETLTDDADASGGLPLDSLQGLSENLGAFLGVGIAMTDAVERLHRRGIIHKDLKPANVLLSADLGLARLTGFGVATGIPRERTRPEPPEVIAGTLAYMAPEQTGRMNRSIDSRSDLYSLGVILFEALSGELPFTASDPMEWIHCHIARAPARLHDAIPLQLSAIVMKLLAKTAEERYQTAAGLASDLRRCQSQWAAVGRIEPFPLGAEDQSERLLIPEKLYGREAEIEVLLQAFERVATRGTNELVLVSGAPGVGKSSVVSELHRVLVPRRGLFAAGKFDQYKRDIPYATVAQAFQGLVRQLLGKTDEEVNRWRDALREALGANGQLLVSLIPELELIIGLQPPVPPLSSSDEQSRFNSTFRRFVSVFARAEHPLALFFDDLQWLDAATLELFSHLLGASELRHLLLVGAYRDSEVGPAHPLAPMLTGLRETRETRDSLHEVRLSPLDIDNLGRLLADALHTTSERTRSLAALVHEKTAGNPFFSIQFIGALADKGLLVYDAAQSAWLWEDARIRAQNFTDNVVELMVDKLARFSPTTQQALQGLACLGGVCKRATLMLVRGESEEAIEASFWEATHAGLVVPEQGAYRFLHDRVQEAAYELVPEARRASEHLRLGRLLSTGAPEELEERLFEIVSQFNRGVALIQEQDERERVAELNLLAGKRARASTAYSAGLSYAVAGSTLLNESSWHTRYPLCFALEFLRAECESLTGALPEAAERLSRLTARARSREHLGAVACLHMTVGTAQGQPNRAVCLLLEYLAGVGVHWSDQPTDADVRAEYEALWERLGERSIESLFDAPRLTDPEQRATLEVLITAAPPVLFTAPNLFRLIVGRMASLSIQHGNSDASCLAYVFLGMVLGPYFGDHAAAFRFGQLGFDLCEKAGLDRFRARVLLCFGTLIVPWSRPFRTSIGMVRTSFDVAEAAGDLEYVHFRILLLSHLFAMSVPLADLQREGEDSLVRVGTVSRGTSRASIETMLGLAAALRGETASLSSFTRPGFDEKQFEAELEAHPRQTVSVCRHWVRKLQLQVHGGDYAAGLRSADHARKLLWLVPSLPESAEFHSFSALALAGSYDGADTAERAAYLDQLREHDRQLATWTASCPENFGSSSKLVKAELARVEGQDAAAMRFYEEAIELGSRNGSLHHEAIASELAARFHLSRGFARIADTYLRHARGCYLRWGALGKVIHLDQRYPRLAAQSERGGAEPTIGTVLEHLDMATVAKASQALSSEMVLSTLSEKLMRIAVEHAGAERGLLVVRRGDTQRIEASAVTGAGGVEVTLHARPVSSAELPESVLQYVARTGKKVILDDATTAHEFSDDPHFALRRCRSVLCLPLAKQSRLVGILYLENNLVSHVFTPRRTAVLDLLASQAAISIDNARLYGDLDRSQGELSARLRFETLRREVSVAIASVRLDEMHAQIEDVLRRVGEFFEADGVAISSASPVPADIVTSYAWTRPRQTPPEPSGLRAHVAIPLSVGGETIASLEVTSSTRRSEWPEESVHRMRVFGEIFASALARQQASVELVRSEAALSHAQNELSRVSRVTTVGELAASIAHEINQPLTAIVADASACLNWLGSQQPDFASVRESLEAIVRDGDRAGQVLTRIRALLARTSIVHAPCDLDEVVRGVLPLVGPQLARDGIALETVLAAGSPQVMGDPVQLQQVVLNLVLNGADASRAVDAVRRRVVVRSFVEPRDGERWVVVVVEDSGIGIDAADLSRLFEPFYTTKLTGLGMGLSISRSVIDRHGGRISAVSKRGDGATFRFELPALESA